MCTFTKWHGAYNYLGFMKGRLTVYTVTTVNNCLHSYYRQQLSTLATVLGNRPATLCNLDGYINVLMVFKESSVYM